MSEIKDVVINTNSGSVSQESKDTVGTLTLFFGTFACIVLFLMIAALLSGPIVLFGRSVTVVEVIYLLFQIFKIVRATLYTSLIGFVVGILYIVLLAFMIKCACRAVKNLNALFNSKKNKNRAHQAHLLGAVADECIRCFLILCIFLVLVSITSETAYTWQAYASMVLTGCVFVIRGIVLRILLNEKPNKYNMVFGAIKDALIFACICLCAYLIKEPAVDEFFTGWSMLTRGNIISSQNNAIAIANSAYLWLIAPVFICIFSGMFLYSVYEYMTDHRRVSVFVIPIVRLLISVGVILFFDLLFKVFFMTGGTAVSWQRFVSWLGEIKSGFLPILIYLAIWLAMEKLYKPVRN